MIHLKTEVGDKSTLFSTQEISGSTDVQITHRNFYAIPQIREFFQGLQPLARFRRKTRHRRRHQVAKRFFVASPHPSTHLVKIT